MACARPAQAILPGVPVEASSRTYVTRLPVDGGTIEMAYRRPCAFLRPFVRQLTGYTERTGVPVRRREFANPYVVVILELAPPVRVFELGDTERSARYPGGFAAGIGESFTLVEHDGLQSGIQLNLTSIGARRFFGVPASELTGRSVPLRDLLGPGYPLLHEELMELPDWDTRLQRFESVLAQRIAHADAPSPAVAWAVAHLEACGGVADIGALARELGYSRKHLIRLFHEHVGVPPKRLARILRFEGLVQHLRRSEPGSESWTALALRFGYYDQSHLIRDVRQFTGTTPTEARDLLVPVPEDVDRALRDPEVNSFQSAAGARR